MSKWSFFILLLLAGGVAYLLTPIRQMAPEVITSAISASEKKNRVRDSECGIKPEFTTENFPPHAIERIKQNMRDPESFQLHSVGFVERVIHDGKKCWAFTLDIGAKNGFGGYNRIPVRCYMRNEVFLEILVGEKEVFNALNEEEEARRQERLAKITPTPAPTPPIASAEARAAAVSRFPDLAKPNSLLNRQFVARYERYRTERPEFFKNPNWPLAMATECALGEAGPATPIQRSTGLKGSALDQRAWP